MKRCFKGLVAINDVLDDRYQNLCDKYHALELSHNRKKKVLKVIEDLIQQPEYKIDTYDIVHDCPKVLYFFPVDKIDFILKLIDDALYSDGRERQVPVRKPKKITMRDLKARKKCKRQKNIIKNS